MSGVSRSWRDQPRARSIATCEPPAAAVSAAPYSAIEIMMYAASLPLPTLSSQSCRCRRTTRKSAAGKISVKTTVRRLRSIRRSSMRSTVRLKPPSGGTRADGRVDRGGGHRRLSGQADEGVLEAVGGDLEVAGVGVGEQVAGDRVAVLGVHEHGVAADLDAGDAGERGEGVGVGAGQRRADGAAGGERLDLGAGAVGDDPAVADQHDPVGVLVRLLEVVRREQHRAAALGVARGSRTRRYGGPRRPCRSSARRAAAGRGRRAAPSRTAAAAARRPSTSRPSGRRSR